MDPSFSSLPLCLLVLAAFCSAAAAAATPREEMFIVMPSEASSRESERKVGDDAYSLGTRWGVLVAGSSGYWNYRHQADVCHAYQILRRGGLKEENIVVFMYDDIAYSTLNPHPGTIINSPGGSDVYAGVPKDYTGEDANINNLFGVILGNKSAVAGGSGKVVSSGPDDHIFIYYTDHGGPGVLAMPTYPYMLYANDLIDVLKQKHASGTYKEMVIYVEACESGSMFEGILPGDLNIYVTTASNAEESSWGTYCPGMDPSPPPEYETCLGDLYSVAWMEDSEVHNLRVETLHEQYEVVKDRTSNNYTYVEGSHVMQYGDVNVEREEASVYIGSDPAIQSNSYADSNIKLPLGLRYFKEGKKARSVSQREADLVYFWHKYLSANEGTPQKKEAELDLMMEIEKRTRLDGKIELLGELLFGNAGPSIVKGVRPTGEALVDDWNCLKAMVGTYEKHCGRLGEYGMKHMRAFANMCNAGMDVKRMAAASTSLCRNERPWI